MEYKIDMTAASEEMVTVKDEGENEKEAMTIDKVAMSREGKLFCNAILLYLILDPNLTLCVTAHF